MEVIVFFKTQRHKGAEFFLLINLEKSEILITFATEQQNNSINETFPWHKYCCEES